MPRNHYIAMHRVQTQELQQHEEQEDHDRAAGAEEILPFLPQAIGHNGKSSRLNVYEAARVGA